MALPIITAAGPITGFNDTHPLCPHSTASLPPSTLAPVQKHLGIPYARSKRFSRPVLPAPWTKPLPCTDFGPAFPQARNPFWALAYARVQAGRDPDSHPQDETKAHCVNVFAPEGASEGDRLPVMVWIYGGGLENGSSEEPLYDATAFVRGRAAEGQRVIVVSGNYRTGVLGWFAGEGVGSTLESEKEVGTGKGNYGLYDVVAMFEWVQKNIGRFGGDPGNVTAFGESAGAFLISTLFLSRRKLFHRAILQSGAPLTMPTRPLATAYRPFHSLVRQFCPPTINATPDTTESPSPSSRLAILRALTAETLVKAHVASAQANMCGLALEAGPHATWTASVQARLERGERDPWIESAVVGTNEDEGTVFTALSPEAHAASGVLRMVGRWPRDVRQEAARLYPDDPVGRSKGDFTKAPMARWAADWTFDVPALKCARALERGGAAVWMYRYRQMIKGLGGRGYGVAHGMELAAVFDARGMFGANEGAAETAGEMGKRWAQFAIEGKMGDGWERWVWVHRGRGEGMGGVWAVFEKGGKVEMEVVEKGGLDGERKEFVTELLERRERDLEKEVAEQGKVEWGLKL